MSYSKVTKKGQITIPVEYRRKYNLEEGAVVVFKEVEEGLTINLVPDIANSAGALAKYADPVELIKYLMKTRKEDFR